MGILACDQQDKLNSTDSSKHFMMYFLLCSAVLLLLRQTSGQTTPPLDHCSCYCCPGKNNPYGLQPDCDINNPTFVGDYALGDPILCSAAGCNVNFGISCPVPPLVGPRNTSGIARYHLNNFRWGCNNGCRNGPDGITPRNATAGTNAGNQFQERASSSISAILGNMVLIHIVMLPFLHLLCF